MSEEKGKYDYIGDFDKWVKNQIKETGKSEEKILTELFNRSGMFVIDETVLGKGHAFLDKIGPWETPKGTKGEKPPVTQALLTEFRRLREEFAPVTAGIEYHRGFTSGSGFVVTTNDPKDKFKQEVKRIINKLNANIYQDEYNIGLDHLGDVLIETALTDGASGAEIVYGDVKFEFMDFVKGTKEVVVGQKEDGTKIKEKRFEVKEPDWKKFRKDGITRLKIINEAITRLDPIRDTQSFEVLYWVIDKGSPNQRFLHTWQVLWLAWNTRGTKLKGTSLVKPVYTIARLLEQIQKAVGINFKRWADKKYFFVCGTEKRPWGKAHMANFIRDVKRMKKKNLSAIPVPAGFSVEAIGGEIFEGTSIVSHLLSMIAAGMQYPLEFLESGKTQASDKAWLAWLVRYGRNQNQVRRAFEHQLWKRHLWCIYGKTRKVKAQSEKEKKAGKNKDVIPIYVPKLEWKAEGKWARDTKIKTLKMIGDMADPASPPLHIAMQKDMADTLGYGELDWDDIIELSELQTSLKISMTKRELLRSEAMLKRDQELDKEEKLVSTVEEEEKRNAMMLESKPSLSEKGDKLKEQQKKRLVGGTSRTPKGPNASEKKGKSKSRGAGPRQVQETTEEVIHEVKIKPKLAGGIEVPISIKVEESKEVTDAKKKTEKKKQELLDKKNEIVDKVKKELGG